MTGTTLLLVSFAVPSTVTLLLCTDKPTGPGNHHLTDWRRQASGQRFGNGNR
jgi:hypothetical protein